MAVDNSLFEVGAEKNLEKIMIKPGDTVRQKTTEEYKKYPAYFNDYRNNLGSGRFEILSCRTCYCSKRIPQQHCEHMVISRFRDVETERVFYEDKSSCRFIKLSKYTWRKL